MEVDSTVNFFEVSDRIARRPSATHEQGRNQAPSGKCLLMIVASLKTSVLPASALSADRHHMNYDGDTNSARHASCKVSRNVLGHSNKW
jgi:hypothetical protein